MSHTALSRQQFVMWNMRQSGDDGAINQSDVLLLRGRLNVAALRRSIQTLVQRQEALRSRVELVNGTPMQTVDDCASITLDLQDFSAADARPALKQSIERCLFGTFDLARDHPLRVGLFKLGEIEHILAIVSHHIINDDRSAVILAQEISALYNAYAAERPSPLSALPAQYTDFAREQNEYLRTDAARRQLETWRKHFTERPPLFGRAPEEERLPAVCVHFMLVPREQAESLQRCAQSQGISLFLLLLAAYKIVLARWTGAREITVSMLLDGRRHAKFKNVIGCFASMQWVRTTLPADLSVPEAIREVRRTFWAAYGTQASLVEWQLALSAGHAGPGQGLETSINFHNSQQWHWRLDGLTATRYTDFDRPVIKLAWDFLWFDLDHQPEGIQSLILYNEQRFDAEQIQALANDYLAVLEQIPSKIPC